MHEKKNKAVTQDGKADTLLPLRKDFRLIYAGPLCTSAFSLLVARQPVELLRMPFFFPMITVIMIIF